MHGTFGLNKPVWFIYTSLVGCQLFDLKRIFCLTLDITLGKLSQLVRTRTLLGARSTKPILLAQMQPRLATDLGRVAADRPGSPPRRLPSDDGPRWRRTGDQKATVGVIEAAVRLPASDAERHAGIGGEVFRRRLADGLAGSSEPGKGEVRALKRREHRPCERHHRGDSHAHLSASWTFRLHLERRRAKRRSRSGRQSREKNQRVRAGNRSWTRLVLNGRSHLLTGFDARSWCRQ